MNKLITMLMTLGAVALIAPISSAEDTQVVPRAETALEKLRCETMLFAQVDDRAPKGQGFDRRRGGPGEFGRQRKHLEQLRMLKMLELLDLEEDQQVEFLTRFNQMRGQQRAIEEQNDAVLDSMRMALNSATVDNPRLEGLIDRSISLNSERHQLMQMFFRDSRDLLTPVQVGKLLVFHQRFESEILERLGKFRGGRPGTSGPDNPAEDEG